MRIISGKYGGRIIKPPGNFKARPTTDLAKESLFNILSNHWNFNELDILDLFSGTGSVGFEFISRGAASVVMIERNYTHFRFIRKVAQMLPVENVRIMKADVCKAISKINQHFDIVFADPPYDMPDFESIPGLVFENNLLKPGGWFILEHSSNQDFMNSRGFFDSRKYGSVNFSFFKNTDNYNA